MTPVYFDQANSTLSGGPAAAFATSEDVGDLQVCRIGDPPEIISCWKPSLKERLGILFGFHVWLRVATATTHPPIIIQAIDPWA